MSSQAPNDTRLRHTGRSEKILATGGLLAALAASSCCVVPLLLFGLGVSGAWIVHLTRLAPYHPTSSPPPRCALGSVIGYDIGRARPAPRARSVPGPCQTAPSRSALLPP